MAYQYQIIDFANIRHKQYIASPTYPMTCYLTLLISLLPVELDVVHQPSGDLVPLLLQCGVSWRLLQDIVDKLGQCYVL